MRFPEAGGSSSFARHAFNEVVSFGAAWAQMLNYIITIAISAFFVPHYLSIFWEPLKTNPWDIIVGAARHRRARPDQHRRRPGGGEAEHRPRGHRLRHAAPAGDHRLRPHLQPAARWSTTSTGASRRPGATSCSRSRSGWSPTRGSRPSRTWPRRRATRPATSRARTDDGIAVFAIYFTLPAIAVTALPVHRVVDPDGCRATTRPSSRARRRRASRTIPCSALVENLGISNGTLLRHDEDLRRHPGGDDPVHRDERGRDRSVAHHLRDGALPAAAAGLPARAPALPDTVDRADRLRRARPDRHAAPGKVDFLSTMYSFGAMLSFTIAHLAVITLRARDPDVELVFRGRPNLRIRGIDWPLFAFLGAFGTLAAWLVIVDPDAEHALRRPRLAGGGFLAYWVYRRFILKIPLTETVEAPAEILGPSLIVEYRTIVVPILRTAESEEALIAAARLAAERRATIAVVRAIEVPLELDLQASMPEDERRANRELDDAQALVESYGVNAVTRLVRARQRGAGDRRGGARPQRGARHHRSVQAVRRPRLGLRAGGRLRPQEQPGARDGGRGEEGGVRAHAAMTLVFSLLMIGLGIAILVRTALLGGGHRAPARGYRPARRRLAPPLSLMAKKLQGLSRVLGPRPLASVAYGEIASSLTSRSASSPITRSASRPGCCSRPGSSSCWSRSPTRRAPRRSRRPAGRPRSSAVRSTTRSGS